MLQNESELLEGGEEWEKWTVKEWDQGDGRESVCSLAVEFG